MKRFQYNNLTQGKYSCIHTSRKWSSPTATYSSKFFIQDQIPPVPSPQWDGFNTEGRSCNLPSFENLQEFFSRRIMFLLSPLYYLDHAMTQRPPRGTIPIPEGFLVTKRIGMEGIPNGMVLESEQDMIIVFRGTKTPAEWYENIHFNQISVFDMPNWWAHSGFWDLYRSLVQSELNWLLEKASTKANVYISATSMGAALGSLLAFEMALSSPDLGSRLTVYTFGSPRVMSPDMADEYDRIVPRTFRILNHQDPVTRVPFGYGLGLWGRYLMYKHVGNNFQIIPEPSNWMPSKTVGFPHPSMPLYHSVLPAYYTPLSSFFLKYETDFNQPSWKELWCKPLNYCPDALESTENVTMRICAPEDL